MSSRRRTVSRTHGRESELPTRSRPETSRLVIPSSVPPRPLPNQFSMPLPYVNNPTNAYEATFDGYTFTAYVPPPVFAPGFMGPVDPFGNPLPYSTYATPGFASWSPMQPTMSGRIIEISDDEYSNMQSSTARRPIPIIDNPPPGTTTREEDHQKAEARNWLEKASEEVRRDQREFQAFSHSIIAKALTRTPHEQSFFRSMNNGFSSPQLLRCIYYLSSKLHEKGSASGYRSSIKAGRVKEGSQRHAGSGSYREDRPRQSEDTSRQSRSGRNRPTRNRLVLVNDEEESDQDDQQRPSARHTEARHSSHSGHTSRNMRTAGAAPTTDHNRTTAASAAASAAINRAAYSTCDPDSTIAELTLLRQHLANAEAELSTQVLEQVELRELKEKAEARRCKICYIAEIDCIFVDCYHMATCLECAQGCERCPVCRKEGVSVAKVYL